MTRKVTYWKANAETSAKIAEALKRMAAKKKAAAALALEVGAVGVYWSSGFVVNYVSGFVFENEPDLNFFCRLKNAHKGWKPRRVGSGKELWKRMDSLSDGSADDIANAIGMNCFFGSGCSTPGAQMVGAVAYVTVPDRVKPKGCTRLSDIEFEKVTTKASRKKPKPAKTPR